MYKLFLKGTGEADARIIAAKGLSEANRLVQASLTKELVDYTVATQWDGVLPTTTGGVIPMLNIK